jgi:ATP-dependent DNA helicase HFM1/MER3
VSTLHVCFALCFVLQIGLVLLDEVHLLNESGRGSSLEAGCVCRIKALAAFPEMAKSPLGSVRFVAVSATIPNIGDVSGLLTAACPRPPKIDR